MNNAYSDTKMIIFLCLACVSRKVEVITDFLEVHRFHLKHRLLKLVQVACRAILEFFLPVNLFFFASSKQKMFYNVTIFKPWKIVLILENKA